MPPKAKARSKSRSRRAPKDPTALDDVLRLKDGVLAAFREWDADGSGTISQPELKQVLVAVGVKESDVPMLFSLADTNKDGQIDYEEFVAWLFVVAPRAAGSAQDAKAPLFGEQLPPPGRGAAEAGGHPAMQPIVLPTGHKEIMATVKLAAPVCPHLDFTIKASPSTAIREIVERICENHDGSIQDPVVCVNRFHPEEVRPYDSTLEECGVVGGSCVVYYDFVAQSGKLLA